MLWYYNLIPDFGAKKIVCPFHNDVNPSMIIDLQENRWFCFGCGESGDALKFVLKFESMQNGLNDLNACKKYFEILRSKKCSDIKIKVNAKAHKKQSRQSYAESYDYYHGLKKINWETDSQDEVIEARDYMLKRGFESKTLNRVKAKITYNRSYPVIFPMLDNGKFKGWVCRTDKREIEKKRKYLYNEGFSRATTLVGEYGAKKYVFVVEGYMDRLKFVQFGVNNVAAVLGWKMTHEQIQKLKNAGVKIIISALDNDKYGNQGTEYLKKFFDVVRFHYFDGIKDPGEMKKSQFVKMYRSTMQEYKNKLINGGFQNGKESC